MSTMVVDDRRSIIVHNNRYYCTLIAKRTYTLTSGAIARFGKRSLIIIFLGILILSVFTRLVSFGFRSLQSISRVLAAPGKGAKLLFLYVFRVCHVYNMPTCPLKAIIERTTNPRDQLKRHSIQTFKEFNFNYFTVNLLSIFISNSIKLFTQTSKFQTFSFWSVYCSPPLRLLTRTHRKRIKHHCNFHYNFYVTVFFSFRSRQLIF